MVSNKRVSRKNFNKRVSRKNFNKSLEKSQFYQYNFSRKWICLLNQSMSIKQTTYILAIFFCRIFKLKCYFYGRHAKQWNLCLRRISPANCLLNKGTFKSTNMQFWRHWPPPPIFTCFLIVGNVKDLWTPTLEYIFIFLNGP